MNVEVSGRAETLDEGDRPGVSLGPFQSGLLNQERGDCPVDHLQHWRDQLRMGGEEGAQGNGERQYPLPHRHPRDDIVDQMCGGLGHAPRATGGAKPAPLARERHQLLVGAFGTAQPQKPVGEDAAFKKRVELVLDELRQGRAGARFDLGEECLEVFPDQLIQRAVLGAAALVVDRVQRRYALQCWAHDVEHPNTDVYTVSGSRNTTPQPAFAAGKRCEITSERSLASGPRLEVVAWPSGWRRRSPAAAFRSSA